MSFELVHFERKAAGKKDISHLGPEAAKRALDFHKSFDIYEETPLAALKELSKQLGVKGIYVKDESYRFGLNAFKVLGGSYAIGNYIAEKLGKDLSELPYRKLISEEVKQQTGDITFISATDGNHGRGVAWTANKLKQKSIIYMPKGSALERLENIKAEGALAEITEFNYDDAVRLADKQAGEKGWVLVQDTAWEGYEDIPTWIMQGYTTMAYEAYKQLGEVKPTHIFVQAGVGSLAGAVQGFFAGVYGEDRPVTAIVEPNEAACIYKTAKANDGKIHPVTGDMNTIMAGLACGEPTTVGWEVLKDYSDYFISCPDYSAAQGMRVLGNPIGEDRRVISGESGAAGFGLFYEVLTNPSLLWIKEELGINEDSVVLFFNSEGDTDRENYRKIVWDGLYPRP
ncbi:diaminopropionate ammonia-lyase [Anaerocolumna sp. AGMB13020]|uniref:diaminopropionate ammonia-lyase n=1 Tax=Anaerocolumna sp. AGMB13020 TaxID=3081750 RepID=UPI0029552684|nr:diaminopropionate ammonia-lyase [Anaerocolumna sp. AGMB13020]WOO38802.1 diaminopropionate ammonia-lyase [Anaerocolumna sp. AGMB13020]